MRQQNWTRMAGRDFFTVSVSGTGAGDQAKESRVAIETALAILDESGFRPDQLARSRLWARDAESRQIASNVRRDLLADSARSASASFIDPNRLAQNATMMIDLTVLATQSTPAEKTIQEYDPPMTPAMFVAFDGMVFFSGYTSMAANLGAQLAEIRAGFDRFLEIAGTNWSQVTNISVFLARPENSGAALAEIAANLPPLDCRQTTTLVEGFSAPEKRVEIEVTAKL